MEDSDSPLVSTNSIPKKNNKLKNSSRTCLTIGNWTKNKSHEKNHPKSPHQRRALPKVHYSSSTRNRRPWSMKSPLKSWRKDPNQDLSLCRTVLKIWIKTSSSFSKTSRRGKKASSRKENNSSKNVFAFFTLDNIDLNAVMSQPNTGANSLLSRQMDNKIEEEDP